MASNPVLALAGTGAVTELPQNLEAEAALLGALMIDNALAADIQSRLKPEHFHEPLHARLYEKILQLIDQNMLATPVTLRPLFQNDPALVELGGPAYLVQMTEGTAGLLAAGDFARQIYDLALLRALITVGRDLVTSATDTSEDVDPQTKISEAEMALYQVAEQGETSGQARIFKDAATIAVKMAGLALKSGGHLSGLTTGLNGINAKTGGLHRSDLVILAGRPAMGKTALATNIAFSAAEQFMRDKKDDPEAETTGAAVAFFSLEMSADQLATRILAEQSKGVFAVTASNGLSDGENLSTATAEKLSAAEALQFSRRTANSITPGSPDITLSVVRENGRYLVTDDADDSNIAPLVTGQDSAVRLGNFGEFITAVSEGSYGGDAEVLVLDQFNDKVYIYNDATAAPA
ncbi:MAG: DnaB-like helicase C-terminal domain-containing protein, partial [Pseudomonadota bacterium]